MDRQVFEKLISNLEDLKKTTGDRQIKRLNVKQLERVIKRLGSFSNDCTECENDLLELHDHIGKLKNKQGKFEKMDLKEHRQLVSKVISHLQKEHKLVMESYYIGICMSIGAGFGLMLGMLLFDNSAMGVSIGVALGVAIGASLDADAKKKNLVI